MKKIFGKIILLMFLIFNFGIFNSNAKFVDFGTSLTGIQKQSIKSTVDNDFNKEIKTVGESVFDIITKIATGLLVLFVVIAGVMMATSMGENEEDIKKGKKGILYALMGIFFINVPGVLYSSLTGKTVGDDVTSAVGELTNSSYNRSIFVNTGVFGNLIGGVLDFLQVLVVSIAILMIIYQGFKLVMSFGKSDSLKEPISKINYSIMALIFIGVMNVWRSVMFTGDFVKTGAGLFGSLANLALYFAVPTGVVFISWAGYLYITANGKDDNIKKAKSIFVNTFIGVILLLGVYYFLNDLSNLSF